MFDLSQSDAVFKGQGEEAYRVYQREKQDEILERGVAFDFISGLLSLNDICKTGESLVEVILLSRNDPDTGFRVFRSISHYGLDITRAIFLQGRSALSYIPALNISLFLSGNESDVREAVSLNYPAGLVVNKKGDYGSLDHDEIRVAFDFDGVLASDEAEKKYSESGLEGFKQYEVDNASVPIQAGLLKPLLESLAEIQKAELDYCKSNVDYKPRLRISIVTARNAPAHERVILSMRDWGVMVNDAFFLGGIDKGEIMSVARPDIIYFLIENFLKFSYLI